MTKTEIVGISGKFREKVGWPKKNKAKKTKNIFSPYGPWQTANGGLGDKSTCRAHEWTSFPPLVTAVLIKPKNAESAAPGSRRVRVTGELVYFLPPKTVGARGGGGL